MSMRPSSKPCPKTDAPSAMFSNNGVIEFRTGVVITAAPDTAALDDVGVTNPDASSKPIASGDSCPVDDDCGEVCTETQTAAVKNMVFTAVKAAVLAQNKAVAATNAMRESAAAELQAKTIATEMEVRRIVKKELLDQQFSLDMRTAHDAASMDVATKSMRGAALDADT
ncbi:hypothetical protein T484DRAFT_1757557, partial [Baffinella frigidus]